MRSFTALAGAAVVGTTLLCSSAFAQTVPLTYEQTLSPSAVAMVQQQLHRAGAYPGAIDGRWGPDSVIALQRYQQAHGLQPSGQLNQATVASLRIDPDALLGVAPARTVAPVRHVEPRAVAAVQGRLRELGYYHGAIDGVWGPRTGAALAAYQAGHGLQSTGGLNAVTVGSLGLRPGWVFAGR